MMPHVTLLSMIVALGMTQAIQAREIDFSGMTWDVKSGDGRGPGPNSWSDSTESVYLDGAGDLHLKIRPINGQWYTSEIISQETVGYGRYEFRLQTDPDAFDPNVVVGLFVYENDQQEIDIEFSRWGDPQAATYAQYALQPYFAPGNLHEFDMQLEGYFSTHIIDWTPDLVTFTSIHGHHSSLLTGGLIEQWTYAGADIPVPSGERLHLNFWLFRGAEPLNGLEHELVIDHISYTPLTATITGDYNSDGFVSQADLDLVLINWGDATIPAEWIATDQFDGVQVGQNELDGVLLNWGNGAPPSVAIPEPTTLLTFVALLGAASTRPPRHRTVTWRAHLTGAQWSSTSIRRMYTALT